MVMRRCCKRWLLLLSLASLLGFSRVGQADPPTSNQTAISFIDLGGALRLAGVENLDILLARERVEQAVALRQLAAAQFLPNLNGGLNVDVHTGPLQQASGNILKVNRDSMYVGAGAYAVSTGTVNIPGVVYNLNLSDTIFRSLASRQLVARRRFANIAIQNEMLRRVAGAYLELLRAEALRGLTLQTRSEAEQVARMTAAFVKAKQGRQADADRAATELADRMIDQQEAEQKVSLASARLAELLNLDPTTRLHPVEERIVPMSVVPNAVPLPELLGIAMLQRPELGEQQASIRQAFLELSAARVLPFAPNLIVGFSGGAMGGGSNIAADLGEPRFGNWRSRNDFDAVMYWTLQNLGVGNVALIRAAESRARGANLEQVEVLNRVRAEVAHAFIETHVQFARIESTEEAVRTGIKAFEQDFVRVRGLVGLPIELLQSLRLLGEARHEYLDAITSYNQAELNLYVALGQPPLDVLARPVPTNFAPQKNRK
jgi:outer membrane protein TolC